MRKPAMDNQQLPQAPLRSSPAQVDSDGDNDNDQYASEDESQGGDVNANGDAPRKIQRRPMTVS